MNQMERQLFWGGFVLVIHFLLEWKAWCVWARGEGRGGGRLLWKKGLQGYT